MTLIEMVVVLAIIAILAAILTPIVTSYVDRARTDAAQSDVKKIAASIVQFNTDTKVWPIYKSTSFTTDPLGVNGDVFPAESTTGSAAVVPASGTGADWTTAISDPSTVGDLDGIVNKNSMGLALTGTRAWKGAYIEMSEDPWGTKYYLTGQFLKPGCVSTHTGSGAGTCAMPGTSGASPSAVYVISAGPNQTLDTNYDQPTSAFAAGGDDIVARIK